MTRQRRTLTSQTVIRTMEGQTPDGQFPATWQLERRLCSKKSRPHCQTCATKGGHGQYWHCYYRVKPGTKLINKYWGVKPIPPQCLQVKEQPKVKKPRQQKVTTTRLEYYKEQAQRAKQMEKAIVMLMAKIGEEANPWVLLGLSPVTATEASIKARYNEAADLYHPSRTGTSLTLETLQIILNATQEALKSYNIERIKPCL